MSCSMHRRRNTVSNCCGIVAAPARRFRTGGSESRNRIEALGLLPGCNRICGSQALQQGVGRMAIGQQPFLLLELDDGHAHGLAWLTTSFARFVTLGPDEV